MSRPTLVTFNPEQGGSSEVLIPADFSPATPRRQLDGGDRGLSDGAVNAPFSGEATHFGTFTWDSQTNEVSMDSAMARMLGRPSPMIGARLRDLMDLVCASDRERIATTLRSSLQSGRDFREELHLSAEDQPPLKVRMVGKVVSDVAGQPKTAVCAVHPLAPLHHIEPVEESAPDAHNIEQICHDLRSPIGAILGYAQLVLNDSLPDQTRAYVEKINKNCEQLLDTISASLDQARSRARGQSPDPSFSPGELVNDVGEMFEVAGIGPNIQFDYSDADHWSRINCDRLKLRRVLINLVDNALKYTDSGKVSVSAHVTRDASAEAFLILSVNDTGRGLNERELRRVFDPFYQRPDQGDNEGVGLGLSICQNLSRAMGGELTATSEPGTGSCFKLRVPVEVVGVGESSTDQVGREPVSALVIGADNTHNRAIVEALSADGCEVRWTDRADTVGSDQAPARVALVDSAHEATAVAQIQSLCRHAPTLPVIAVCDKVSESQAQRLLDAGAGTLLVKPFLENELMATLRQAVKEPIREAEIPDSLADPIADAAQRADIDGLNGLIDELEAIDRELARDFKAMASRMDYDSVLDSLNLDKPKH